MTHMYKKEKKEKSIFTRTIGGETDVYDTTPNMAMKGTGNVKLSTGKTKGRSTESVVSKILSKRK